MPNKLTLEEEYDFREEIEAPQVHFFADGSLLERKKIARNVLSRKPEDILLIAKTGFSVDSIFAGLTEKSIEYFAKNAPLEYKKELLAISEDADMKSGVWEIAQALDSDDGSNKNTERIQNIVKYIQNNTEAFF